MLAVGVSHASKHRVCRLPLAFSNAALAQCCVLRPLTTAPVSDRRRRCRQLPDGHVSDWIHASRRALECRVRASCYASLLTREGCKQIARQARTPIPVCAAPRDASATPQTRRCLSRVGPRQCRRRLRAGRRPRWLRRSCWVAGPAIGHAPGADRREVTGGWSRGAGVAERGEVAVAASQRPRRRRVPAGDGVSAPRRANVHPADERLRRGGFKQGCRPKPEAKTWGATATIAATSLLALRRASSPCNRRFAV